MQFVFRGFLRGVGGDDDDNNNNNNDNNLLAVFDFDKMAMYVKNKELMFGGNEENQSVSLHAGEVENNAFSFSLSSSSSSDTKNAKIDPIFEITKPELYPIMDKNDKACGRWAIVDEMVYKRLVNGQTVVPEWMGKLFWQTPELRQIERRYVVEADTANASDRELMEMMLTPDEMSKIMLGGDGDDDDPNGNDDDKLDKGVVVKQMVDLVDEPFLVYIMDENQNAVDDHLEKSESYAFADEYGDRFLFREERTTAPTTKQSQRRFVLLDFEMQIVEKEKNPEDNDKKESIGSLLVEFHPTEIKPSTTSEEEEGEEKEGEEEEEEEDTDFEKMDIPVIYFQESGAWIWGVSQRGLFVEL